MGKSDISFVFTLRPSPSFLLVIPLSLPLSSPSTYTTSPICTYTYILYCRQLSALAFLVVIVSIHPPPHFSPTVSRASRLWAPSFLVSSSQVPRCFGDVLPPLVTPPNSWRPHSSRQLPQFDGFLFFPHFTGCNSAAVIGLWLLALRCLPCIALPPLPLCPYIYTINPPSSACLSHPLESTTEFATAHPASNCPCFSLIAQRRPPFSSLVTVLLCLDLF